MKFRSDDVGVYRVTVAFEFKASLQEFSRPFYIVRFIEAEFRTELAAELAPIEPYRPFKLNRTKNVNFTVDEGLPPERYGIRALQL